MSWLYSDAYGTIDSVRTLISNARAANPSLKFAIATVPQRTYIRGREDLVENTNIYNNLLPDFIERWTTTQSPIHIVKLDESYDCQPGGCPAGEQWCGLWDLSQGRADSTRPSQATTVCIPTPGENS